MIMNQLQFGILRTLLGIMGCQIIDTDEGVVILIEQLMARLVQYYDGIFLPSFPRMVLKKPSSPLK